MKTTIQSLIRQLLPILEVPRAGWDLRGGLEETPDRVARRVMRNPLR